MNDLPEFRQCSICKESDETYVDGIYRLFHWSTRRYAHAHCMKAAWTPQEIKERLQHAWILREYRRSLRTYVPAQVK